MLGMLSRTIFLRGLKSFEYHKLAAMNYRSHLPCSSRLSMQMKISSRKMCGKIEIRSARSRRIQTTDGVPPDYDIIYNSFDYHTASQHCFVIIPAVSLITVSVALATGDDDLYPTDARAALYIWIGCLALFINIGFAMLLYRAPVRIYHSRKTSKYLAVFNHLIPTKIRTVEFTKGSVMQILPSDELTWFGKHRYQIHGKRVFMFDWCFRYPSDLYNMFDALK